MARGELKCLVVEGLEGIVEVGLTEVGAGLDDGTAEEEATVHRPDF